MQINNMEMPNDFADGDTIIEDIKKEEKKAENRDIILFNMDKNRNMVMGRT